MEVNTRGTLMICVRKDIQRERGVTSNFYFDIAAQQASSDSWARFHAALERAGDLP